jgi:hypothetical protein
MLKVALILESPQEELAAVGLPFFPAGEKP